MPIDHLRTLFIGGKALPAERFPPVVEEPPCASASPDEKKDRCHLRRTVWNPVDLLVQGKAMARFLLVYIDWNDHIFITGRLR